MNIIICTKFHVNRMNCVESVKDGGGGGSIDPLKCSFFEASGVNRNENTQRRNKTHVL